MRPKETHELKEDIILDLAKEYGLSKRVVKSVVYSPLRFLSRVVANDYDDRAVRIPYFGVFHMRKRFLKAINDIEQMGKILLININYTYLVMRSILNFPITSVESARRIIIDAIGHNDIDKITLIFREFIVLASKQ